MSLHCPKCRSTRVRRGYEKPPIVLRVIGWQGLLCDNCNLSYQGFAIPGTVPKHSSRGPKRTRREKRSTEADEVAVDVAIEERVHPHHSKQDSEGAKATDVFSFAWYYVKLQCKVVLGLHQTSHSLSIKYRWHNWLHWQRNKRS